MRELPITRSASSTNSGIRPAFIVAELSLILSILPGGALGAGKDCAIKELTDTETRQVAQENFECMNARLAAALARVDALEASMAPFADASGAVVAFNRDRQRGSICPRGWSYFEAAGGRLIVGAGEHDNGLRKYPSFVENPSQAIGGEESHVLTLDEMPRHNHANGAYQYLMMSNGDSTTNGRGLDPTRGEPNLMHIGEIVAQGGDQPHNNLPPYVALYYCLKN